MTWVRVDNIRFKGHAKRFAIPLFGNIGAGLEVYLSDGEREPEMFVAMLKSVVLQFHPELAELQIIAFAYNMARNCWEVTALHPSLPAVASGEVIEIEVLELTGTIHTNNALGKTD